MTISERIARLPAAVNIAEPFQAQLTQAKPEKGRTSGVTGHTGQSASSTETYSSLTKSLYAADNSDYTKADAVNKQWRKMNTVNLFDVLNGTADTSNRTLSAGDVEKMLQQGGLLDEVSDTDFSMLKFEFSGLGFESGASYRSVASGEFRKNLEYLASRYAAMEDKIKTTYTGTEQKERLDRLNEMYETTLERAAKSYSEIVGGILEDYGVSGEKEKIYQSFKSGVDQKAAEYRSFLEQNKGFTGLEDTEDEWLLKDDEYIAARLRAQGNISGANASKSGEYSLQELDALGQYASSLSEMAAKANPYETNEERIGLDFAMLAMKTDVLGKEGNRSSAFQATLQKALGGYLNAFLEQFSRKLENNRKNARTTYDIQGNAGLDADAVWRVYDKTMEQYRLSGNAMEALIKGVESGRAQYAEKMESSHMKEIYRYKNSGSYWNDFFGNSSDRKTGSYHQSGSIYEQYMMGWLDFKNSLGDGESVRMNLSLKPIGSYPINQSGNWVSTNG